MQDALARRGPRVSQTLEDGTADHPVFPKIPAQPSNPPLAPNAAAAAAGGPVSTPGPLASASAGGGPATGRHRRRDTRYPAVADRLWVQWWDGDEHYGRAARLVNVSRRGALIVCSTLLRERQPLRIYLEEPAPQIGVSAMVLGVVEGLSGHHQMRLGFINPCPDAFIDAAAHGFEAWLASGRA